MRLYLTIFISTILFTCLSCKKDNIQQIIGLVGQETIWGQRVPSEFTNRTLPHFPKYDISPESKGYTKNSFITVRSHDSLIPSSKILEDIC